MAELDEPGDEPNFDLISTCLGPLDVTVLATTNFC